MSAKSTQVGFVPLVRFLTSRSGHHLASTEAAVEGLGSLDDAKKLVGVILAPGADFGRVKQIWPLLTKKFGKDIMMAWLQQWKKQADQTAAGNKRAFESTHLIAVFAAMFSKDILALFADINKFSGVLTSLFSLAEALSAAPRRHRKVAFTKIRRVLRSDQRVYDMSLDMAKSKSDAKFAPALIESLLRTSGEKFTQNRAAFFDLLEKVVLSVRGKVGQNMKNAFVPLLHTVSETEFKDKIWSTLTRQLKRSPDCLDVAVHLFANLRLDTSDFAKELVSTIQDYLQSADDEVRRNSSLLVKAVLSSSKKDLAAVQQQVFDILLPLVNAGNSNWYARFGLTEALAAVGRTMSTPSPVFAEKASLAILKGLEKESNKECIESSLECLSTFLRLDASKVTDRVASVAIKGAADKDYAKLYLLCLFNSLRDVNAPNASMPDAAVVSALAKPLLQIIASAKTKIVLAPEAMLAAASLATLAARDSALADLLKSCGTFWNLLFQNSDSILFSGSPSLLERLTAANDAGSMQAFSNLLASVLRFHSSVVSDAQQILNLLMSLMLSEKKAVREAALSVVEALHPHVPSLSSKLLHMFHSSTLPTLANQRSSTEYLEGVPAEQRNILRRALLAIVAPSLLDSEASATLSSLFLIAHHPLLVKARDTSAVWKRIATTKLGFADLASVNSQHGDSLIQILFSESALKSTNAFKRGAGVYAVTTLLEASDAIPHRVLDSLVLLLDSTAFCALSREERGIILTPADKFFKTPQLKEYIPEFKMDKNVKSDDDEVEAKRKLNEARRKHFIMVQEKMSKVEAEQIAAEQKIRERVLPIYTSIRTAIEAVIVAAQHRKCVQAFASRDGAFVFRAVDLLYDLMYFNPHQNDLSPLAARALAVLSSHIVPPTLRRKVTQCLTTVVPATPAPRLFVARLPAPVAPKKTGGVSLASSSASANNKQREEDELALAEKRQARALVESAVVDQITGVHIEPSSWALLQVVFGSVFTPIHPVEIQERSVAQLQRHLGWVNQRLVNILVNVLENAPFVADDAKAALEEACGTHLTPFKPLHFYAIPSLVHHAALHPNADVRRAVLKSLRLVRSDRMRSFGQKAVVIPHLWLAKFGSDEKADESSVLATQIYDSYKRTDDPKDSHLYSLDADYFDAVSKPLGSSFEQVRSTAARALVGAMELFADSQSNSFDRLIALYKQHSTQQLLDAEASGRQTTNAAPEAAEDLQWRRGIASTIKFSSSLSTLAPELLVRVFKFLCEQAIYDPNSEVYNRYLQAGVEVLNQRGGGSATEPLQTLLESYLSSAQPQTERQHRARQSVVVFLGTLAQHLMGGSGSNDAAAERILSKLLEVLKTPSEPVQRSVAQCLSALAPRLSSSVRDKLLKQCLRDVLEGEDYGERRGAAYGIAGIVRGIKVPGLRKLPWLMEQLEKAASSKDSELARSGASLAFECISTLMGRLFEPWVIKILPYLLNSLGDNSQDVREATADAAKAIMSQLTGNGINLVLPALLKGLDETEKGSKWRARAGGIDLLGTMAYCQPDQLGRCLPTIIPKLSALLADTHDKVQKAARDALNSICGVIKNPEISKIVPKLLKAVDDPVQHTATALEALAHTHFVNRIDSPSLSLLMPILDRALRDRQTETKKNATKIVGSMVSLTEPGALRPYSKMLLEHLKVILADPIPQTRTAAAVALGLVSRGLDAAHDVVPNLMEHMKSEAGAIERAGAAQGLAHVIAHSIDLNHFRLAMLPRVLSSCGPPASSATREGYLSLFQFLPESLGHRFEAILSMVLPTVIRGLADESESVRDAALKAGQAIVSKFGDEDKVDLVIPTLQHAMFNDNWRIRTSSTQLLSELLYKISGANESFADKDIAPMLANPDRQATLATLYVLRQDLNAVVRQNAGHVWKLLVVNTPKTLRAILPNLMDIIIEQMSSQDEEKRDISSKTLGELVEKLGERVLGDILPILNKELQWSPHATTRVGVILGITEILAVSRDYVSPFVDDILVPSIRRALCDANTEVREAASLAFDALYKCINEKAIEDILPPLLAQMEDPNPDQSELALHGLQQMLTKRSALILPSIIPKLTNPSSPLSAFNARALASIAEVSNEGFFPFLRDIVAIFMRRLHGSGASSTQIEALDDETRAAVDKSLQRIVTCMRGSGLNILFVDMFRYMQENNPMLRVGAMDLIGTVCRDAKVKQADPNAVNPPVLDDHLPNLIQASLRAFNDPFGKVVETALQTLTAVMALVGIKEDAQSATSTNYVQAINDTLETMGLVEGATLAGFNLPGGLNPILPMFLQVLRTGSQDEREQSALGIRLMLERTEQAQLKPYLQQITGPLIRILAERTLNTQTRTAMLQTLNQVVTKGGIALRPFAAQLQTTYVKALGATTKVVRDQAAQGIKLLLVLGAKADFLIKDLIKQMRDPTTPAPDACLDAIVGVLKGLPAGAGGLSAASVQGIREAAQPLLAVQDPLHRAAAARALGTTCRFSDEADATEFIRSILGRGQGDTWLECEGGLLTLNELLADPSREPFAAHVHEQGVLFPYLLDMLKHPRPPVRCAAIKCIGSAMVHLADINEKLVADLADRLAEMLTDESNDVKIASLVAIKDFAKARPGHAADQLNVLVPPIMNKIKEKKVLPIKFAAERALLHVLQIKIDPKMPLLEHYATKVLTDKELAKQLVDYCKRVLSKLPQFSEDEEDGGFSASLVGGKDL